MREFKPNGKHQLHLIDKDKKPGDQEKVQQIALLTPDP